jgi:hypothetical protein
MAVVVQFELYHYQHGGCHVVAEPCLSLQRQPVNKRGLRGRHFSALRRASVKINWEKVFVGALP